MDVVPHSVQAVDHSAICSLGWTPTLFDGFLLKHLRAHFADRNTIEQPNLKEYLWKANFDLSGLAIESIGKWRPESASLRPAVLTRRNDYKGQRIAIGDRLSGFGDGVSQEYLKLGLCSITVFCLAALYGEAESLGIEVHNELERFADAIRSTLPQMMRVEVLQMGRPMPVQEASGYFGIPVTVAYAHNSTWKVTTHAPVLRTIELEAFSPTG